MTEEAAPKGVRIAKLLARAGVASRREIERMIAEGRVAVDGRPLDTPATLLSSLAGVTVDGRPVDAPEAARLFVYHKPAGLLVTEHDPAGRPIIYDRLPVDLPRVMPVGRLDLATEGLLLLTTDGGLKRALELPATGVERTYRARAYGDVTQAMLETLIEGVEIDGIRYGPIDANLERRTGANTWIELTLTEGKNREVRRVLEYLGLQVGRLIRTRYGPFVLGDLPAGAVGEVRAKDLSAFAKTLGGARRAKGADLDRLIAVEPRDAAPRGHAPSAAPLPPPSPPPPAAAAEFRSDRPRPANPRADAPRTGWGSRARPSRPVPSPDRATAEGRGRPSPVAGPGSRPRDEAAPDRRSTRAIRAGTDPRAPSHAAEPGERPRRDAPHGRPRDDQAADRRSARASRTDTRSPDDRTGRTERGRPAASARTAPAMRSGDETSAPRRARPSRTETDPRAARRATDDGDAGPRRNAPDRPPGKGPSGGRGHPPRAPGGPRAAPHAPPPRGGPRGRR